MIVAFFNIYCTYFGVCGGVICMYLGACVEAGRQLARVHSFFPPSGSQGLKSGLTASAFTP